jgi:hypothetical protein
MNPPLNNRGKPWTVEFDPNYKAYYYFNGETGVSEWVEDDWVEDAASGASEQTPSASTASTTITANASIMPEVELTSVADKGKKKHARSTMPEDESSSDDDEDVDTSDGIELISDAARVAADTQGSLNAHWRCLLINACLCEAPLAVIEALCRAVVFGVFACALLIIAACTYDWTWVERSKACAREAVLTLAAGLSLAVPCVVCFAYRRYYNDEDWDLAPLPTILGWVDAQRFASLVLGGGSYSQQRSREREGQSASDTNPHSSESALLDFHEALSLDSWQDKSAAGILMAPRKVFRSFHRIARGDEGDRDNGIDF